MAQFVGGLVAVAEALRVPVRLGPVVHRYLARGPRPVVWAIVRQGVGLAVVAWRLRAVGRRGWSGEFVERAGRGLVAPLNLPWAGKGGSNGKA